MTVNITFTVHGAPFSATWYSCVWRLPPFSVDKRASLIVWTNEYGPARVAHRAQATQLLNFDDPSSTDDEADATVTRDLVRLPLVPEDWGLCSICQSRMSIASVARRGSEWNGWCS